ncbi:BON1-associated protein 2 [Senna tora]|uniref:BON1-associated protein 2 n=1 Tax=Senna tora TaxID=362788 RepID=A0A834TCQ0_9FABA|nr:BON1-associated protein 2 [Senna tora]
MQEGSLSTQCGSEFCIYGVGLRRNGMRGRSASSIPTPTNCKQLSGTIPPRKSDSAILAIPTLFAPIADDDDALHFTSNVIDLACAGTSTVIASPHDGFPPAPSAGDVAEQLADSVRTSTNTLLFVGFRSTVRFSADKTVTSRIRDPARNAIYIIVRTMEFDPLKEKKNVVLGIEVR